MTGISNVRIGRLALGERPAIAVALTNRDVETLETLYGADLMELRIDMFDCPIGERAAGNTVIRDTFVRARQRFDTPIIATCRSTAEGGFRQLQEDVRFEVISSVTPLADAVDIEINSPIAHRVIDLVRQAGKMVIASYHNFQQTPPIEELTAIISRCKEAGAHITKIATMANSQGDLQTMALLTLNHQTADIVTISMGRLGMASRVFLPLIGSLFTFASIETVSAPGQMSIQQVSKFLR
ncbi:MAG: type I 3-dehydroquinate dehydratase [Candidatus Magnetobacterium sp. LHC-1]|uniref:3-dehydroquinate dehydratase n=1 Tax=Candidatus Magnetobacterium casense TaxID=1455061 RepID=A0ABS6S0T0_9BACT|nr:type I 3-dehydroquinate dehydratase [Candidatus Magnetobacterium casensis]MBF0609195.1 type I 3-dehydroquinate dehydratase [Nitrospirota bacterium]MBV6342467.1 type I 3-dehydroquinate dehydratase [Candidatus Magnetobacterium casensis]